MENGFKGFNRKERAELHDKTMIEIAEQEIINKKIIEEKEKVEKAKKQKAMIKKIKKYTSIGLAVIGGTVFLVKPIASEKIRQHNIDKENQEEFLITPPEELSVSKYDRELMQNVLIATEQLRNNENLKFSEREKYERIIIDAVSSGRMDSMIKDTIEAELKLAVELGNSDKISKGNNGTKIKYINSVEDGKAIRITDVPGECFQLGGMQILSKDIPENLENLTLRYMRYNESTWEHKDRKECLKWGLDTGEMIEKVIDEHYAIDDISLKNGSIIPKTSIIRISDKEFEERYYDWQAEQYMEEKELQERVYSRFGIDIAPKNNDDEKSENDDSYQNSEPMSYTVSER